MMLLLSLVLVLSPLLGTSQESESITYYIKPYGNVSCLQEPCMTLPEYAEGSDVIARREVILIFMAGTHVLDRKLTIDNSTIVQYSMIGEPSHLPRLKSIITCSDSAGSVEFSFANISSMQIKYLAFYSCISGRHEIQYLLRIIKSRIAVIMSSFQHNVVMTSVLDLYHSNMTASNCSFTDNSGVGAKFGVTILSYESSILFTGSNTFVQNSGHSSGAAIALLYSTLVTEATKGQPAYYTSFGKHVPEDASISFLYNQIADAQIGEKLHLYGVGGGACIMASSSIVNISGISYYIGNSAEINRQSYGGCIYSKHSTTVIRDQGTFVRNKADDGGAICTEGGTLNMTGNFQFISNSAKGFGGAMLIHNTIFVYIGRSMYRGNSALNSGGSIYFVLSSKIMIYGSIIIDKSSAAGTGAAIAITYSRVSMNGEIRCYNSSAKELYNLYGAVLTVILSELDINGTLVISQTNGSIFASLSNFTISGRLLVFGALHKYGILFNDSKVLLNGTVIIKNNLGIVGGLNLLRSTAVFQGHYKISQNIGTFIGGLFLDDSTATFQNLDITLLQNSAVEGGGIYLSPTSKVMLNRSVKMYASGNKARNGGAIFVQNFEDYRYCLKSTDYLNQGLQNHHCFFQIIGQGRNISLVFDGNNASLAGDDLFGGRLEKCTMNNSIQSGLDTFRSISEFVPNSISNSSSISSVAMTVCFCKNDSLSYDQSNFTVYVQRGEIFKVPLVAVGQANSIVPAVIRAQFKLPNLKHTGFGQNQAVQLSSKQCHPLTFALTSAEDYVELSVFADGLCKDIGESSRTIAVHFLDCFVGFQLSHGECICHQQIQHLTNTCHPQSGKIRRLTNWWIGIYYSNGSFQGLITYPHCPFDYCRREEMFISLEYPDSQCALNRSGMLCGACQHGLSLTLGGSECDKCDSAITTPIVLLVALIAGVILVITLLVLRLNVAVGTINGLVFYANIVSINKAVFFPAGDSNILTVFIAWVNLDLGIKTCFYNGLDMYSKVWLQFLFPAYLWLLLAIIIVGSHYSTKISRLFGRNPVACLSTLILLSYTKILRNIITILAFTYIEFPNSMRRVVWLHDASVEYIHGKHIALVVAALCTLVFLFAPYTLILTTGQWVTTKIIWKLNRYLQPFLDAYYAPFKPHHCYWPGALLILRCILLLVFTLNTTGNVSNNVFAIIVVLAILYCFRFQTGFIYKNWTIEILEMSFFVNLLLLSAATSHVILSAGNQRALVYVSVGLVFTQFIGIIVYHTCIQIKQLQALKIVFAKCCHRYCKRRDRTQGEGVVQLDVCDNPQVVTPPSTSYIDLRETLLDD